MKGKQRMAQLAYLMGTGMTITSAFIRDRYGVSWATAKRDLQDLEEAIPTHKTVIGNKGASVRHELRSD